MTNPAMYPLRLPRSVKDGVERAARRDGVSMNQFIAIAVAEKLAALDGWNYLSARAERADFDAFDRIMAPGRGEPPREGDELPEGYVSPAARGARAR